MTALSQSVINEANAKALLIIWKIIHSVPLASMPQEKLIRIAWALKSMPRELSDSILNEADKRARIVGLNPGDF